MKWEQFFQTIPGQELAQNVLDKDLVSVLGLVISLLVVVIIIIVLSVLAMMVYNNRAINTMAATQKDMSNANAQWAVSDSKKTEALNRSVDELTLLRQDYMTGSGAQQKIAEQTNRAVEEHEAKSDGRVKTILDQVTVVNDSIQGAIKDAVSTVNDATLEAVKPALEAINKLVVLGDSISTRQDATLELLRKQHEEEIRFVQEQNDAHMRVWRDQLTHAQQQILDGLKQAQEKPDNETPIQDLSPLRSLVPADPVSADPVAADPVAAYDADTRPGRDL